MEQTKYNTPWSTIGYLTMKRTYARRLNEADPDSPTEEFHNIIDRVVSASNTQLKCGFTVEEQEELRKYLMELKGSVAGRFLWQLGTQTVDKLGLPSLQNCFSGSTKILTSQGTKSLKELKDSEIEVYAKGTSLEATVKSFGSQELFNITFGLPSRSNQTFEVQATKNHRWELLDGSVSSNLKIGDKVPFMHKESAYNKEAFMHGLIYGDGSVNYRYANGDYSHMIRLCGKKEKYKDLFDKYHYQPNCEGDPVAYQRSNKNYKELPYLADSNYISSFVAGWCAADGSITPSGSTCLSTSKEEDYFWLLDNAAHAGLVVTGHTTYSEERSSPLHKVTLSSRIEYAIVRDIVSLGIDEVFCAIVPGAERFTLANGLLTCNCAFTVVDSPVRPFTWTFDMLMLGSGVGYNIQKQNVNKLPEVRPWFKAPLRVDNASADFVVPDTREGWVVLLGKTLKAAFLSDSERPPFTYSTQLIRGKGAPIKGFGGTASGPEDLCWGIAQISKILERRAGEKIRPIDVLDIMNIIGAIVVAGNVRRSAQIAIGDHDDLEFLLAKRWDLGNIPSWRAMSNNSVVCEDTSKLHDFFWDGYEGKGEPYGLINLKLSRAIGRIGETQYPDPNIQGYNPCAEQSLEPFETCCLAEIFLPNITSLSELQRVAYFLYRINKHSLALPSHNKETETIVHKNMRMGIGMTGILQATDEQRSWLNATYEYLRMLDDEYSARHGFPKSIKLTTVKPSGTLSLLPGVVPGIHPAYAQYMIRRIRISAGHQLVQLCKDHGYDVEYQRNFDGSEDRSTMVVSFPFSYPEGTVLAKEMTAIRQLEMVKNMQEVWSDNSVSCTVYYRKEELPEIKKYLAKNFKNNHKSLSFLLHSEHGFAQAPYEEITKEEYDALRARTSLITNISMAEFDGIDECASGACPIK